MIDQGSWLHGAFAAVHTGLLLILLIQTAFTQSNLASNTVFAVQHDAVATLWYIVLTVLIGRVLSSGAWYYVASKKGTDAKVLDKYSRMEKIALLVVSALATFPAAILFGSTLGPTSTIYVDRGADSNLKLIIWVNIIQGVWSFLELAWSHLYKIKERTESPTKTGINKFLLLVMIIMFIVYAFTSTVLFLDADKLKKSTFSPTGTVLKNALDMITTFALLQFVFMIVTFVLYLLKSMKWADKSTMFNTLAVTISALAFEFSALTYGMTLPYTSVVDVLRHEAMGMSNIPESGSLMKPNLKTLSDLGVANFFMQFTLLVVIHLAAYSRHPM
jgi:hypothetical protein